MKRILFLLSFLLIIVSLSGQTIYVPGDYSTIQDAIDHASDNYEIIVSNGTYGAINYGSLKLDIQAAYGQFPVISSSSTFVVNMGSDSYSSLSGFTITGNSSNIGIYLNDLSNIEIEDCKITDCEYGVYLNECLSVTLENCEFSANDYGIFNIDTAAYYSNIDVLSCNFTNHDQSAIYLDGVDVFYLFYCFLYENTTAIDMCDDEYIEADIDRCTIVDNHTGISWGTYSENDISSSIVYDNATNLTGTAIDIDISYSCIEGGSSGSGNTDDDPLFCNEYPYEYWLLEGSPCIDTGDPAASGGDNRIDMGCHESVRDIKKCEGEHWNYVSFPRLLRDDNDPVDVVPLLEDFLDWDFDTNMRFENSLVLYYIQSNTTWTPTSYNVQSTRGYKLDPHDSGDHFLPTVNFATRLSSSQTIDLTDEDENWIGYWLPYTQNIRNAFGDFWEYIYSVEAEDWYYEWDEEETPTSSTSGKNLVYGKAYIVVVNEYVEDFYWAYLSLSENLEKSESQQFSFNYLSNYEAIDVMDIPENIIEIGVFEDDVCVGAVVIQNEDEQILAYTLGQYPVSFEVVTGSRQENQQILHYEVLNKETGIYENRPLISGRQKHSVISFRDIEDQQHNTPSHDFAILHGNYPNPFNPETTISFNLTTENTESTELIIYNMKGQKVKQLLKGQLSSGEHSFSWNGTDDEGKPVSSGLYLYKLKVGDRVFSKKMLMLK